MGPGSLHQWSSVLGAGASRQQHFWALTECPPQTSPRVPWVQPTHSFFSSSPFSVCDTVIHQAAQVREVGRTSTVSLAPLSTFHQPQGQGEATEALIRDKNVRGCHKTPSSRFYFVLKYY